MRIFLACGLVASACGQTEAADLDAAAPGGPPNETTGVENTTSTAPQPSTSAPATTPTTTTQGPIEGYEAPEGWKVRRQLGVNTALLGEDGVTIEVTIIGGPPLEPTEPCAHNYELVVGESATEVRATIFELLPSAPDAQPGNTFCTTQGHGWRLASTLQQPLGNRTFVDDLTGDIAPPIDLATALLPTYAPPGWEPEPPWIYVNSLELFYTNPSEANGLLYVRSDPISDEMQIDSIRARDLVRIEEITVRSLAGLQVTSREDGAVTIVWEEDGRLHQVHGYLIDPSELVAMAEAMR